MLGSVIRAGAIGAGLVLIGPWMSCPVANATGERPGRYTMSPAEGGGFARLDTETGQMSLCQRAGTEWSCRDMGDPRRGPDQEIERLRADNQRLKAEIRQMEDTMLGDRRAETGPRNTPELKLPSEQDIDSAMTYVQRMLRKFREKIKEFETDSKGTPL